ncbi:phosphoenolpyruvate--protein phosphotransferase [Leifsonia bigeumensis]|uniref:Phosphoenolpyruvate-protein phosphotransferase n=1 Tax=Leifsonella bigeumensis TaxID=433643 RepID=A0ABP7EYQ2_9MICO
MKYNGLGVGLGVVVGPVRRMFTAVPEPTDTVSTLSTEEETARARDALEQVAGELEARAQRAGGDAADVLTAQAMMARDPDVWEDIEAQLAQKKTAEWAVAQAFRTFVAMLQSLGGTQAERASDLVDVSRRTVAAIMGVSAGDVPDSDEPFVLVAEDLSPADTAVLDLTRVLALVTSGGSPTAHTAILARAKGLVAVVSAAGVQDIPEDEMVVVDAAEGTIECSPSEERVAEVRARMNEVDDDDAREPGRMSDGTAVPLLANVGSVENVQNAVAKGAEGVGLLRTEFMFLEETEAPTVEEQIARYSEILEALEGRKAVARTLDAGADKPLAFLPLGKEENPALGVRGIRTVRDHEPLMRDQLTALAAAAAAVPSDLWVMAPMVADATEAEWFATMAREAGVARVGVMIEVPSSAIVADQIFGVVDFVSIGTNDLTQYTLAADRQNGAVASYQDAWHPSVLRLIGMVGDAATASGKPLSVCGEAASDPLLAVVLVGLGVTSLSMVPNALKEVRATLLRYSMEEARMLAQVALATTDAGNARGAVKAALPRPPR